MIGWMLAVVFTAGLVLLPDSARAAAQDFEQDFKRCLAELGHEARARGLATAIVAEVLAGIEYQPRVIELDRAQPEFTQTFAAYLRSRVTQDRVRRGRELLT